MQKKLRVNVKNTTMMISSENLDRLFIFSQWAMLLMLMYTR